MKTSRYFAPLMTCFGLLLALSAASPDCWAQDADVYFVSDVVPPIDGDFNSAANWTHPLRAPGTNLDDVYGIDFGLSATFSGGTDPTSPARVRGLGVGSTSKFNLQLGEIYSGRLTMTGGTLEVIGDAALGLFSVGRENIYYYPKGGDYNKNTVVDAADYVVWRNTFGSPSDLRADGDDSGTIDELDYQWWKARFGNVQQGGEIIMTGTSTLRAFGVIIGERTPGLLSVGPNAVVDLRIWVPATVEPDVPAHFAGTADMRIGSFSPAYDKPFDPETPYMFGNGLVDLQGTLNANVVYVTDHGAKGELRLSGGGTVNLNGELIMDLCAVCVLPDTPAHIALLAQRSAKVSIIGSDGTFNVGLDPDPLVVDPTPPNRNLLANSPTAIFSFTADMGGVTPIVVVDNVGETSGSAYIDTAKLVLNLDAYTGTSPLTLINAPAGNLVGDFDPEDVTFLGSRTATVFHDVANGDVLLINFQGGSGAGTGSLASTTVPEPSGQMMILTLGLLLFTSGAGTNRQTARLWG